MEENALEEDSQLVARGYQLDMVKHAIEKNTIIFLPTGAGKTFVSIMLMKHYAEKVKNKSESQDGKRIIFIAPKVELVKQQAYAIRRHTNFSVEMYVGSMGVDNWNASIWKLQIEQHEVLVMSAQVLYDCFVASYLTMDQICLLVIDECHHVTEDHPMNLIMRHYYDVNVNKDTRILGLTATLIKRNIKVKSVQCEVQMLERNMQSTVIKLDDMDVIKGLYADPSVLYGSVKAVVLPESAIEVFKILNTVSENVKILHEAANRDFQKTFSTPFMVDGVLMKMGSSLYKELDRIILDITIHVKNLGFYGADIAVLAHMVTVQKMICACKSDEHVSHLNMFLSNLITVRKIFSDVMIRYTTRSQIENFCSPKVLTAIKIIRENLSKLKPLSAESENRDTAMCGIVFVERRITAKVLYHILKRLKEEDARLALMKPDFVVGANKNSFETREYVLDDEKKEQAVMRFNTGETNLLIASDVLEEGMDIPRCNMVIKFDPPKTFCSYVQSKGRARNQNSKYYVINEPDVDQRDFMKLKPQYAATEMALQKIQCEDPETSNEVNPDADDCYVTKLGAVARPSNSLKILYRFCSSLSQDKFSDLQPRWFIKKLSGTYDGMFQAEISFKFSIVLPLNTFIKKPIEGKPEVRKKDAKNSAALKSVILLHEAGALDDFLRPSHKEIENLKADKTLFPFWEDETATQNDNQMQTGTKKKKRKYDLYVPYFLRSCGPTIGQNVYMHLIVMQPAYEKPPISDVRRTTFYNLLNDQKESFAILSSKPWPMLCQFPIFMNVGKVNIAITTNYKCLVMSNEQLACARHIHLEILTNLLNFGQKFLKHDYESGQNNYLLVPTIISVNETADVNWTLLNKTPILKSNCSNKLTGQEKGLYLKVVTPWYRAYNTEYTADENKNYIVTQVCDDLNPDSVFSANSTNSLITYKQYYKDKYSITIKNLDQPLLAVKAISNKLNCINPRGISASSSKRKRFVNFDDFDEVLVPELCSLQAAGSCISAQLWLKATSVPTILYRVSRLLLAEDLRQLISRETGLGIAELSNGQKWDPFEIDETSMFPTEKYDNLSPPKGYGPPKIKVLPPNISQKTKPWNETEPIDLDRNIDQVTTMEISEYVKFANIPLSTTLSVTNINTHKRDTSIVVKPIKMILRTSNIGPQQHKLYAALTTVSANESINMERLESLGDSYLKFAASLYLFCTYHHSEGILTDVKGKVVGNRNLYYCGVQKGIPSKISVVNCFGNSYWKVPNQELDVKLKALIEELNTNSDILRKIELSEHEQKSGNIEQWRHIYEVFSDSTECDETVSNAFDVFIDKQTVADKSISDCVEAILGAYVESCGPVASARLLSWFGILPLAIQEVMVSSETMCGIKVADCNVDVDRELSRHLAGIEELESQLGYTFKNRGILLQAISHASFTANILTDSFERLEFLGDAVIDFLITCHIYEACGNLSPGELTDLRSSLVNNIVFASLAVRYGFYRHLQHSSPVVMKSIEHFVQHQEDNDHRISEEYLLLLQEESATVAENIDVPKILGDIFESLAGAVFLDSGKNLAKTWEVFYPLMKNEIDQFSAKVPKQPVRMLYESLVGHNIKFGKPYQSKEGSQIMMKLSLDFGGNTKRFFGLGDNKRLAKCAAAKCALKYATSSMTP